MDRVKYHISVKFHDKEPKEGDRVDVTLPGTIVNYSGDGSGLVWIDIDQRVIENTDPDRDGGERALVVTDITKATPGVPELAAGQVYRKHYRTYMVYRDKPLSQGGCLMVRDALTGMMVGEGSLIGADLVYDPSTEG